MNKAIIIDGYSMLFRAYYATFKEDRSLLMRNKDGIPTNAVFAFTNMLLSLLKNLKENDALFVALDSAKTTFRHLEYKDYKANRKPLDEDLKVQFPIFRELLDALNIYHYENPNLEADDIAGNIAKMMEKADYKVEIYTSDKDYLQLINENITVNLLKQGLKNLKVMTPDSFFEEWGFNPQQIIDYKALRGDDSDNLKGIPGIGDKTAKALIKEFGTFENIVKNANLKSKVGQNLVSFQKNGELCLHLATIKTDDDLHIEPNDIVYKGYEFNEVNRFIEKYDFKNLLNKLPKELKVQSSITYKNEYEIIENISNLEIKDYLSLAIDVDENLNYHQTKLYGIALTLNHKNYYIEYNDLISDTKLLDVLKNPKIKKYCFDFKKIKCVLNKNNILIEGLFFDILLATYLLNPSLNPNIKDCLIYNSIDIDYQKDSYSLLDEGDPTLTTINSYFSYELSSRIIDELKKYNQYELLINIEEPLSTVLADMELSGFPINKEKLLEFKKEYETIIEKLKEEIIDIAGVDFNINSPKQLAEILFDKMNLPTNKARSTNVDNLKLIIDSSPIIAKILEYRKYQKIVSTYIDGFIPYIDENGLIHATFNQAITTTGRLSSSEPNLQNISIRNEEGRNLRKAFYFDDPTLNILSLDYSQIELRILAHLSNSETLINAFNNDEDIHSLTAKKVFKLDHEPSNNERRKAKAVNFGIVYGISDWGLAEQLQISVGEAKEIINAFYTEFPEIKNYLNSLIKFAEINKYSLTMFSRRRYLENINSNDYQTRNFEKRAAMNAPIQGSAADLIKIAMIEVHKKLKENKFKSRIISQIHDELILKVYDDEKDEVYKLVKDTMENCVKLKVKLKVDGGYAKNWYNTK